MLYFILYVFSLSLFYHLFFFFSFQIMNSKCPEHPGKVRIQIIYFSSWFLIWEWGSEKGFLLQLTPINTRLSVTLNSGTDMFLNSSRGSWMIFCQLAIWAYAMGLLSLHSCHPLQIFHWLKLEGPIFLPLVLESREESCEQTLTNALTIPIWIKPLMFRKSCLYLSIS